MLEVVRVVLLTYLAEVARWTQPGCPQPRQSLGPTYGLLMGILNLLLELQAFEAEVVTTEGLSGLRIT